MNLVYIILIIIISFLFYYMFINYESNKTKSDMNQTFSLEEIPNILTHNECDQIIQITKQKGFQKSYIVDYNGQNSNHDSVRSSSLHKINENFRNSEQCWITRYEHPVLEKLSKISENLTGFPASNQEQIQIVKYTEGGKFDAHYDSCVYDNQEFCDEMNHHAGQRRTTLLVYLNDVIEGGETEFVNINRKIKPEKGKGILFWSTDHYDRLFTESKHKGNPVTQGEKWIVTIWSHPLPFR